MGRTQLYFEISLENQLGASGGDYFRCPAPGCKQAIWLSKCVLYVISRRSLLPAMGRGWSVGLSGPDRLCMAWL